MLKHLRTHTNTFHPDCRVGYECFFCSRLLKTPYEHRRHLISRHGDHCDLTTPPPTGRFDPRKAAKRINNTYVPPVEARTLQPPTKRAKIIPDQTAPQEDQQLQVFDINELLKTDQQPQVFDIDEILQQDLQISDEDLNLSPTTEDKCIQVRRRDFLTTSRDTQTVNKNVDSGVQVEMKSITKNTNSQTVTTGVEASTQTEPTQENAHQNQSVQTAITTSDVSTQVSFFNAGWITRYLTDAIRAIAPTIITANQSLSIREIASTSPYIPEPGTVSETPNRRGRPRRTQDHQ